MIKLRNYKNIQDQLSAKVPLRMWANPYIKILDPNMDYCEVLKEFFNYLEIGLTQIIPDNMKRYTHIWETQLYGLSDDRIKLAFGKAATIDGYFTSYHREIVPNLEFGIPETDNFWGLRFDIIASFNPIRVDELLKPNGICITLQE